MHGFKGERVLMRIHIGERDKYEGEPLYWAIVQLLRKRHYAGATVTKGIMSFGASSRIHTAKFLELSLDLPIVVECVDTEREDQGDTAGAGQDGRWRPDHAREGEGNHVPPAQYR